MNHYSYEELSVGMTESFETVVEPEMMEAFRRITGDDNPLHCDETFARAMGYPGQVTYGMLTASFLSTLAGVYLPGENSLILETDVKFARAVFPGDRLTVKGTVKEKNDTFSFVVLKVEIINQDGDKVVRGTMKVGVLNGKR
ncbi:MaoC family dehydratase [Lachnospiraceae bacterium JLR.KK008]